MKILPLAPEPFTVWVTNPGVYDIRVQVRGEGGGWIGLSTATRHMTTTTDDVIDQGDVWSFRFSGQGRVDGEISVDRSELEASGWTVDIPESVFQALVDAGAPVPP